MAVKTFSEIVEDIKNYIYNKRSSLNTYMSSVLRNIIDAVSDTIEGIYTELNALNIIYSINNASIMTEEQMDNFASNYDITRRDDTYSTGYCKFISYNVPVSTITIGNIDGTGGVKLSTKKFSDGTFIEFLTTQTVYLTTTSFYDSAKGYYYVEAPIVCLTKGTAGNVAADTITIMQSPISGVDAVTNTLAIDNGLDKQTNEELAAAIRLRQEVRSIGTRSGYKQSVINNFTVQDCEVVGPKDEDSVRFEYGVEVDIYIMGENLTAYNDVIAVTNSLYYYFGMNPVVSISSVNGICSGTSIIFVEGSDYEFLKDTTSIYKNSTDALNKIHFFGPPTGKTPDIGTNFNVNLVYDKNVYDIQKYFEDDKNKIILNDVLVKQAEEVIVDIGFTVEAEKGYNKTVMKEDIIDIIDESLTNRKLGSTFDQSDIIYIIRDNIEGIDRIDLPFTVFKRRTESISGQTLIAKKYEYFNTDANSYDSILIQ